MLIGILNRPLHFGAPGKQSSNKGVRLGAEQICNVLLYFK